MYSIQNTKEVLEFGFAVGKAIKQSLADGKVDFSDVGNMVPVVMAFPSALSDLALLPKELGDLDAAEQQELAAFVKEKLPSVVEDAHALQVGQAWLKVALAMAEAVSVTV